MPDIKEQMTDRLLRKFIPPYRFIRIQANTIDRNHVHQTALDNLSIRILNWNIAKNNHDPIWLKDFHKILEQYQPDLIFLQEVRLGTEAEHAVHLSDMSWSFAPNFIDAHHNAYAGILTAAKTNPQISQAIVTEHHEPIVKTPKVSLVTLYPLLHQSEKLLAINSHLINFVSYNKFQTQLHQLETILSQHQGPIIFAGDFNVWNWTRAALLDQVVARLQLIPTTFAPNDRKNIKRFLLSPPLDYIFYRGLRQKKANTKVLNHISSSDHKPMLAEFSCLS
ncbi:endonuclease/exonuclease/phosphatase family protein [Kovacikia minuta CCNUW1]|uniref:endonuclease/exonuclease/phosphatase family protein n=1 Tax=Kovacikia minuta TaxID=2931930 RepID=UPI001CC91E90|nr:endonuclease/exonuclease/phosphatase family protein [Kovacikia minuta]UBF23790.1 endonuclease/exonuclease/phosphatase family protein [Kovacikia minuta CCNUW1]